MISSITFSIILPTYNRHQLLIQSIQSVINQSYIRWQLIIVDDGSTDETNKIVQSYLDDFRIVYYKQSNQGRSKARNLGLAKAQGDYICFLDDDDTYLDRHLEVMAENVKKFDQKIILKTTAIIRNENKEQTESSMYSTNLNAVEYCWLHGMSLFQICVPKSIISEGFNEEVDYGEDMLWISNLLLRGHRLEEIQLATVVINDHSQRSTYQKDKGSIEKIYSDIYKVRTQILENGANKILSKQMIDIARKNDKRKLVRNMIKGGYILSAIQQMLH